MESVKVFEDYKSYCQWSESGEGKYTPTIAHDDTFIHAHINIKCDSLDTAISHATEIFAEYPAVANVIRKIITKGKASNGDSFIHYTDRYDKGCVCKVKDRYSIFAKHDTKEEIAKEKREEYSEKVGRIITKINDESEADFSANRTDTETDKKTEKSEKKDTQETQKKEERKMEKYSRGKVMKIAWEIYKAHGGRERVCPFSVALKEAWYIVKRDARLDSMEKPVEE